MATTEAEARQLAAEIGSSDRAVQGQAYEALLEATDAAVPWAYAIWEDVVQGLGSSDNRQRSICAQLLANLAAYSDPEVRILDDLDRHAAVMADEKFVTARHTTQTFWKVGLGGQQQLEAAVTALSQRFRGCAGEKNAGLIRTDILLSLAQLDLARPDAGIEEVANDLIGEEPDETSHRKQRAAWKKARGRPGRS